MNPTFKNVVGCNPEHAQEIAQWVEELKKRTGYEKIDIVAHSMGALDVRYYIKYLCGYKNVRKVVMIAGANHGTTVACADQLSCGAKQMCRTPDNWKDNEFLRKLNDCDETPGDVLYTSIWSPYDEIIRPPESSILKGAENIQISTKPVGHGGILAVAETGDLVIYALNQGGKNYDGPSWECLKQCEDEGEEVMEDEAVPDEQEAVERTEETEESLEVDAEPEGVVDKPEVIDMQKELYPEIPETQQDEDAGVHEAGGIDALHEEVSIIEVKDLQEKPPRAPAGGCDVSSAGSSVFPGILMVVILLLLAARTRSFR